jgi:hypothetical protein
MDPIKSATDMVKGMKVSSVLGSILYMTPYTLGSLILVSFSSNTIIQTFLMFIVASLILLFIISFLGILIFGDHKELQSEEHTYKMKALEILGDQNHKVTNSTSLSENNPELPVPEDIIMPKPSELKSIEKKYE